MDQGAFLKVSEIDILYPGPPPYLAVRNVSFAVQKGEKFVLIGPSGCGKTSLLKALAGFIKPTKGQIVLEGIPVREPGPDRPMVFQDFEQHFPWYSVLGNVEYALRVTRRAKGKEARERAMYFLALVGLENAVNKYTHELSGGMKQRLAIARALALEPKVLLMDEPFGALDAILRTKLQHELLALWQVLHFTLVLVTHSIQEAVYLGDRVLVMSTNPGMVREIVDVSQVKDMDSQLFAEKTTYLRHLLLEIQQAQQRVGEEA